MSITLKEKFGERVYCLRIRTDDVRKFGVCRAGCSSCHDAGGKNSVGATGMKEKMKAAEETSAECAALWDAVSLHLKNKSTAMFRQWFACVVPLELTETSITLGVPDDFFADMIRTNAMPYLEESLEKAAGHPLEVKFRDGYSAPVEAPAPVKETEAVKRPEPKPRQSFTPGMRFTFENFVVGEANRYAFSCARSAAEHPGELNPLYIYGGTGLGKTHLLYAVANMVKLMNPAAKVCYIPSENFLNDYVKACMNHSHADFRDYYRNLDLLLIDDVHNLANKTQLQEEFFNTFNAIYSRGGQIILTSDKQPSEIKGLEDRLVSRFQQGAMTQITPPGYETRLAILKAKQETQSTKIPPELLMFIARRVTSQIRALEGALMRIITFCNACLKSPNEITPAMAESMLCDILDSEADASSVDIDKILAVVAHYFNIHVHDIIGSKRPKNIAEPRMIAMYLARHLTDLPLKEIGQEFGGRNHTTVIHAVKQVEAECRENPKFLHTITQLKQDLHIVEN